MLSAEPKNQREKDFNERMTEKAEAIRCRRFESVVNERYDFFDRAKMSSDFLAYFKRVLKRKDQKWKFVYEHFEYFVGGKCRCEEVDFDLCNNFREYLLTAKNLRTGKPMFINSALMAIHSQIRSHIHFPCEPFPFPHNQVCAKLFYDFKLYRYQPDNCR